MPLLRKSRVRGKSCAKMVQLTRLKYWIGRIMKFSKGHRSSKVKGLVPWHSYEIITEKMITTIEFEE
jgi:hypothetical protein